MMDFQNFGLSWLLGIISKTCRVIHYYVLKGALSERLFCIDSIQSGLFPPPAFIKQSCCCSKVVRESRVIFFDDFPPEILLLLYNSIFHYFGTLTCPRKSRALLHLMSIILPSDCVGQPVFQKLRHKCVSTRSLDIKHNVTFSHSTWLLCVTCLLCRWVHVAPQLYSDPETSDHCRNNKATLKTHQK